MDNDVGIYSQLDEDNAREIDNYIGSLNPEIRDTITMYTYNLAEELNSAILDDNITEEQAIQIDNLDAALAGVPPITKPVTLYRGVKFFPDIDVRTFMSTSYDVNVTSRFVGGPSINKICCLLRITASPGTQILPIDSLSRIPFEKEVILARTGDLLLTNARLEPYEKVYGESGTVKKSITEEILVYDLVYLPYKVSKDSTLSLKRERHRIINERIVQELVDLFYQTDPSLSIEARVEYLARRIKADDFMTISRKTIDAAIGRIKSTA